MTMPQPPYGHGQQPSYGYGQQPYGPYPQEHPRGTTILVLGILSLVICGLLGPIAWSMGSDALSDMDAYPGSYSNRSLVVAGRICGIVGTCLLIANAVVLIVILAVVGTARA